MADLKRIGRALQGFSAGVAGRGAEFSQARRDEERRVATEEKALTAERKQELLLDNRVILDLLNSGNVPQAQQMSLRSIESARQRGLDSSAQEDFLNLIQSGNIDLAKSEAGVLDREAVIRGFLPAGARPEAFTLSPGQRRFEGGRQIAAVPSEKAQKPQPAPIPVQLLTGLSPEVADKAAAAFSAAGGGKDGMAAFTREVDRGTEQERRSASPELLKSNFPNASTAETTQLQGAMDGAKNTSDGLKAAGRVREEQRRLKKAQGFQERAVGLLEGILANPELGDVLGSVEGAIDFRLQDSEAELIADIDEAVNIVTSDNMSLMTGVLSETDIKLLKSLSGGGLNRKRSEARFRKDVQRIIDTLSKAPVKTVDDRDREAGRPAGGQPTRIGRFNVRQK